MRLLGQFFFHNKISQTQNCLQRTKIKKKYAQKTSKRKKLLIPLFAFCAFILLALLVKTKSFEKRSQETSFYVFTSPTKLDFICIVLV